MARRPTVRTGAFVAGGSLVTLLLALVVSGFASGSPDGLERVAEDEGFLETARDHLFTEGPLADYTVPGVDGERLSTGLSGVVGVVITFAVGAGLFALFRRRTPPPSEGQGRAGAPGRGTAGGGPGGPDRS